MTKIKKTTNYFEISWLILVSCLCLYLGVTYSVFNIIVLVVPVPIIIIGYKYGYGYLGLAVTLTTLFSIGFIEDIFISWFILVVVGANTTALCFFMKEKEYTYKILFLGTFVCTASIVLFGPLVKIFLNLDLLEMIKNNLMTTIDNNPNSQLLSSEPMTDEQISLMLGMIPFMIVYLSAIFVSLNYYLSRKFLVSQGFSPYKAQPIEEFRLPENILTGTAIVLVLVIITNYLKIVNTDVLSQNAIYIFVCVFMFQGLAVVGHLLVKRQIQNPVKAAILVGVFLFLGPLILGLIGWMDSIVDFRKMKTHKRE